MALKLRNRYRALFPGKRLVGISWRSGNRDSATIRSIDLSLWKPIFETPDCAFISLQYGDVSRDLETLRTETGHVVHWDREVDPFQYLDPFTAQIAAMDLVISVDNSTVHFAGAIGKPCWVLLPLNSDWRWLVDRTKSIWYDSLELIRQPKGEGWEHVVANVAKRLRDIGTEPLLDATAEICLRCGEELLRREAMAPAEDFFRWLMETGRHKAAAFHGVGKAALKAKSCARCRCHSRQGRRAGAGAHRLQGRLGGGAVRSRPSRRRRAAGARPDAAGQRADRADGDGPDPCRQGPARPGHRLFRPRAPHRSGTRGGALDPGRIAGAAG